jgi:O-antigen biosynthesis protein WbqP
MFNRLFAFILLVVLLPLFVFISLFILFIDGWPIIFRQKRMGAFNKSFVIYKFRTMKHGTPNVSSRELAQPSSVLFFGSKYIRKMSLDELPNLINIIKGDMVFVGPRPIILEEHELISKRIEAGLESLKPGVTGWAQINGRDQISLERKVELDYEYFCRKSIYFDFYIILLTIPKVLFKKDVSH